MPRQTRPRTPRHWTAPAIRATAVPSGQSFVRYDLWNSCATSWLHYKHPIIKCNHLIACGEWMILLFLPGTYLPVDPQLPPSRGSLSVISTLARADDLTKVLK